MAVRARDFRMSEQVGKEEQNLNKYLDYLVERLGPRGVYYNEYCNLSFSQKKRFRLIPCTVAVPFGQDAPVPEYLSPVSCFSDGSSGVMGVPIIDAKLAPNAKRYGQAFQCETEPDRSLLLHQLVHLVETAKQIVLVALWTLSTRLRLRLRPFFFTSLTGVPTLTFPAKRIEETGPDPMPCQRFNIVVQTRACLLSQGTS